MTLSPNPDTAVNIVGSAAIIAMNIAPKNVILAKTFEIYFLVSLPGRIPGMYPPFLFKFLLNSSGLIVKKVYTNVNAIINAI